MTHICASFPTLWLNQYIDIFKERRHGEVEPYRPEIWGPEKAFRVGLAHA